VPRGDKTKEHWEKHREERLANFRKKMKKRWRDPKHLAKLGNRKYADVNRDGLSHFQGIFHRVKIGKAPFVQWERSREGYLAFRNAIGPKYEEGNIFWQTVSDNVREMRQRTKGVRHK
jgi:hypothetical protein